MAKKKGNDRFAFGISIFILGILFLINKIGILDKIPYGNQLLNIGSIFLLSGIIFLVAGANKTLGWIFLISGIIIKSDFFFGWMHNYSNLIVPAFVIVVGLIMILTSKR